MDRVEYRKKLLIQLGTLKEYAIEKKTGANLKLTVNNDILQFEHNYFMRIFKQSDHNTMYLRIVDILEQTCEIIDSCKNSVCLTLDRKNTKEYIDTFDVLTVFMRALYNSIAGLEELAISYKSDINYVDRIKTVIEDIHIIFQKILEPYFTEKFGNVLIGDGIYSADLFKNINLKKL